MLSFLYKIFHHLADVRKEIISKTDLPFLLKEIQLRHITYHQPKMSDDKAVTKTGALTPQASFDNNMKALQPRLVDILAEYGTTPAHFAAVASNVIRSNKKLLKCTAPSLMGSLLKVAELGLSLSNEAQECDIIPYGTLAQFQPRYGGLVKLAMRSEVVQKVWSEIVFENDDFRETLGSNASLEHFRAKGERGEAIGAYACVMMKGLVSFKYMTMEEIFEIAAMSPAYKRSDSIWKNHETKDPQRWMWKKTVVKQVLKFVPKNERLSTAMAFDNAVEAEKPVKFDNDLNAVIEEIVDEEETPEQKKENVKAKKEEVKEAQAAAGPKDKLL